MKKAISTGLAILIASTFGWMTPAAASGPLNYLGRMFGAGWSDGYHAQDWKFQNRGYPGCAPESVLPMSYHGATVTVPPYPAMNRPAQPTPAIPRSILPPGTPAPGTPVRPQ